jgi:hypothetical protein
MIGLFSSLESSGIEGGDIKAFGEHLTFEETYCF